MESIPKITKHLSSSYVCEWYKRPSQGSVLLFSQKLLPKIEYICSSPKMFIFNIVASMKVQLMILKADFVTPPEQLYKELNWLSFPKRVQYGM